MERRRADGAASYTAQVTRKKDGKIAYRKSQTFDRRPAAEAWIRKKEAELAKPGALEIAAAQANSRHTLGDAIRAYVLAQGDAIDRTKAQVLRSLLDHPLSNTAASAVQPADLVDLATELRQTRAPQTVMNYLSHLAAVFRVAEPAFGIPLDHEAMRKAMDAAKRLRLTAKSNKRDRRPTIDEMNRLMAYFTDRSTRRPGSAPMAAICAFALFSTRRQDEITRMRWSDLEPGRVLIRDMKNPGDKRGNDVWCDLPAPAQRIIATMPRTGERIFPYSTAAISAAFTRACQVLGIEDLTFHDLRHEGLSRLFEMGLTIPHAAAVSGHRNWQSLQRYTHVRQTGDRWDGWAWLEPTGRIKTKRRGMPPQEADI